MQIRKALPLMLLVLAGCKSGPSLVGKWNANAPGMPQGAKVTMEFTNDSFTQNLEISANGLEIKATSKGTYTITDKKIKMTTTDITVDDSKLPAAFKDQIKQGIEKEKGKVMEGELKLEGETATITSAQGAMTLTKAK